MTFIGDEMYKWAKDLFPLNRSLTGDGVRATLLYLRNILPSLNIIEVPSGTVAFDWTVPDEWNIDEAYIENQSGERIVDFKVNNLHVVGYSEPVNIWLDRDELDKHLHSLPNQPNAIPYITAYYKKTWGFCMSDIKRASLSDGKYHVVINGKKEPGSLSYGELILKGESEKEVLLSTYVCHPSMANNEISGIVVTTALALWINTLKNRRYTYRIIFIPETIGSIVYLSQHFKHLKENVVSGFVATCVGDNRAYSFLPSRLGNTLADRVSVFALKRRGIDYKKFSFLERGSDERQFCSPLIDLPVVSIMRSKYSTYPEYHTSLDNLDLISSRGLNGAYDIIKECLMILEVNFHYKAVVYCEPQLGKRGLYNITSNQDADLLINLLAYADGKTDLITISELIRADIFECFEVAEKLINHSLLEKVDLFEN